jgi:hypothetical protein
MEVQAEEQAEVEVAEGEMELEAVPAAELLSWSHEDIPFFNKPYGLVDYHRDSHKAHRLYLVMKAYRSCPVMRAHRLYLGLELVAHNAQHIRLSYQPYGPPKYSQQAILAARC